MDTKKLYALLRVAQIGSMKKAAEELNYTQSGLIYMMNSLEEELGVHLLDRSSRGVALSYAGLRLEPYIREMIHSEEVLLAEIEEIGKRQAHSLRLASYPIFARYFLSQAIRKYHDDYPEDAISIHVGNAEDISDWLNNDRVDLAIGDRFLAEGRKWIHLMDDETYVAIPTSFGIVPEGACQLSDITGFPVLYSNSEAIHHMSDTLPVTENNRVEVSSKDGTATLSMVESQLGIAFISSFYQYDCPPDVKMYPLSPPVTREIGIILKDSGLTPPILNRFVDYLDNMDFEILESREHSI